MAARQPETLLNSVGRTNATSRCGARQSARRSGRTGNLFTANALEARVDTGVGSTVLMRFSTDGRTFTPVRSRFRGAIGKYGQRVRWNGLGQHSEIAVELSCADDTDFAIFEASIDVG